MARNEVIPPEGPTWIEEMNAEVIQAEGDLMLAKNKHAPPGHLFVTNRSCVWGDEGPSSVDFMLSYGFKIPDFMPYGPAPLLDAVKARRRHAEMHGLMHSFQQSANIPRPARRTKQDAVSSLHMVCASDLSSVGNAANFAAL